MGTCDKCGNNYDKSFEIMMNDRTYTFDCFECAIEKLAPRCECCGTKVIGHGLEANNNIYCCAHCSKREGIVDLKDRSEETQFAQFI